MLRGRVRTSVLAMAITGVLASIAPISGTTAQPTPEWLQVANRYRASVGLNDVAENPTASVGAAAHSRYLVTNSEVGHDEDKRKPAYSDVGRRAGMTGNVSAGSGARLTERQIVEGWLTVPFHGVGMLAPHASAFGFGQFSTKQNNWAATLSLFWDAYDDPSSPSTGTEARARQLVDDLIRIEPWIATKGYSYNCNGTECVLVSDSRVFVTDRGRLVEKPGADPVAADRGELGYDKPVLFPGNGSGVPLVRYGGYEYPNPLTSCPGYKGQAGLPIYILRGKPTELAEASVTDDRGTAQQLCTISATTYRDPQDASAERLGRSVLDSYGAVVLLPRNPLQYGRSYNVRARTTDGEVFNWTFRVTANAAIDLPAGHARAEQATVGLPSQPQVVEPAKKPSTKIPTSKRTVRNSG